MEAGPDQDQGQTGARSSFRVSIEDKTFMVDRTTMLQHCDYFQALFRSGMKESRQEEVRLEGLGLQGFQVLLQVLRGEKPALDSEQILESIEVAAFLQAPPLTKHLINIISSENCVLMFHTAAIFGVWQLSQRAALFIRDMYADLRDHVHALPSMHLEQIQSLPPSRYLAVCSHGPASELIQDPQRAVFYLDEDQGDWRVLTRLPASTSTTKAGVAVHHNKLYIVGGVHDVSKKVVAEAFCYDPEKKSWSSLRGPRQPRHSFTLLGHEDFLYAVGGERDAKPLASVEKFHPQEETWSSASSLPRPASSPAYAVAMNRIFICLWGGGGATEIHEYEPARDRWAPLTSLLRHQSYGLHMVAHRDNLYVMRNGPGEDFLVCVMDRFNLSSRQWTALPGRYGNSRGSMLTAAVRGDSMFTLSREATTEFTLEERGWRLRREMSGFGRIGSIRTFLMRL